jgi:hypothetical protein
MKTIYSMGKGKYITLDSYGESHETRRSDVVVFLLASIIATITIAAVLGVDVTQFNTQSQQEQTNATR